MWGRASSTGRKRGTPPPRTSAASGRSGRLAERRRLHRRRIRIALAVLAVLFLAALVGLTWEPAVRVTQVSVAGTNRPIAALAGEVMQGTYFGIIPRDSIFFVPEAGIRKAVLATYPDIAAVSVFRTGFSSIGVRVDYRSPVARWCNTSMPVLMGTTSPVSLSQCYLFDASGFVFAPATSLVNTATSAAPVNSFIVSEATSATHPIGTTLPAASEFPAAFSFARQLSSFGSPVESIVFGSDHQVYDYLASSTYIVYVAGHEQASLDALISARNDFNLSDGSIEYLDLRFPGKIYLKKFGG